MNGNVCEEAACLDFINELYTVHTQEAHKADVDYEEVHIQIQDDALDG